MDIFTIIKSEKRFFNIIFEEVIMKTVDTSRTRLYAQFHSFDKYNRGWYHRMHTFIRLLLRKIMHPGSKATF